LSDGRIQPQGSASTEDLEDLYESAPCGYFSLSPEGLIVKVNRTFCEWTGYSKEQLHGRRLRDLLNVGGRIFYETHFAPLLRMQGFFNEVALDVMTAAGAKLPVLANARERRADNGDLLFTRVTIFLAVERRRYERDLVDARLAADAASRELTTRWTAEKESGELREQFIAVLGHDLRNPLAAIDAGVRILLRDLPGERAMKVLQLIQDSSERMSGIIDNVLDFARGKLGGGLGITLTKRQPLCGTIEQVIAELRAAAPDHAIRADIQGDLLVTADHPRIAQLLSNLLGNAIAHGDPDRPIEIAAYLDDGELRISVANGGPPIPEAAREHLFQPFYRGKVSSKKQGLGLGLFIASEIAKAHGGRIDVVSDASETRFTFVAPIA
jgi:sigma-B regulation protein RsbU (phosphoserine phosphatase)